MAGRSPETVPSDQIAIVILAAGKGTRMKSRLVKGLHRLAGTPIIRYPLDTAKRLKPHRIVVVVGHQATLIEEELKGEPVTFARQAVQLGTGHAVSCAKKALRGFRGTVVILSGDVPLIRLHTLRSLLRAHTRGGATITVLTTEVENPQGYGRIVRQEDGRLTKIVEDRDAGPSEKRIREINTGIYCVEASFLFTSIDRIQRDNAQSEYYLTDVVSLCLKERKCALALSVARPEEVTGINDRADLARVYRTVQSEILKGHMLKRVTFIDPEATYVDRDVKIGKDTVIFPNCYLQGITVVGDSCTIEQGSKIVDSSLGKGTTVRMSSLVSSSRLAAGVVVGPFAHLERYGAQPERKSQTP